MQERIAISAVPTSTRSSGSDEKNPDMEVEESASPFQCLFCSLDFTSDDVGFAENLEHMRTAHGMSISDPELVVDMQSLVGYLATEVRVWHECLYCGATKPSTLSIQSHMRDKEHCLLNFDREPELLDFWEKPQSVDEDDTSALGQELPIDLSGPEIRFPSGRVVGSRHAASPIKKNSRKQAFAASTMKALAPDSEISESSQMAVGLQLTPGRQLARREEMSMLGVSVQQRRALVLAEKKAQRSEAVARRAREWVYARGANSQEFDQVDNQMKWGKQNHKLLPR